MLKSEKLMEISLVNQKIQNLKIKFLKKKTENIIEEKEKLTKNKSVKKINVFLMDCKKLS